MLQKGDRVMFVKERFKDLNTDSIDFEKAYRCSFDEFQNQGKKLVYLDGFRLTIPVSFLEKVD